jgi:anthranilate synthase component 2
MKILILDNYDSFTYNLVQLVERVCDFNFEVHKNDKITIEEASKFDKLLLSPGPGIPSNAGILNELIKELGPSKSILGVCLGMQAIGEVYGSKLINLDTVYHGIATETTIIEKDYLFNNCPSTFKTGRYHSWAVDDKTLSSDLLITAIDENNQIMALRHKTFDVRGVQFHPESILSEYGEQQMKNWIFSNYQNN